jgi:hypothetical protein
MRLAPFTNIVVFLGALTGCAPHAVYFYETEKMSMTLEARPDPSQPVQGNLGLKQRVILVAPRKTNENANSTAKDRTDSTPKSKSESGDSASVLSSTRFSKTPVEGSVRVGAFLIQSVLLTGDAAECAVPNSSELRNNVVADTPRSTAPISAGKPRSPAEMEAAPAPPIAPNAMVEAEPPLTPPPGTSSENLDVTPKARTTQTAKIISQTNKSLTQEIGDGIIAKARSNNSLEALLSAVATKNVGKLEELTGVEKGAYTHKLHDVLRKKLEIDH